MTQFFPAFPTGFDDRAELALDGSNRIIVRHPDHPPRRFDEASRQWVEVPQHEE